MCKIIKIFVLNIVKQINFPVCMLSMTLLLEIFTNELNDLNICFNVTIFFFILKFVYCL